MTRLSQEFGNVPQELNPEDDFTTSAKGVARNTGDGLVITIAVPMDTVQVEYVTAEDKSKTTTPAAEADTRTRPVVDVEAFKRLATIVLEIISGVPDVVGKLHGLWADAATVIVNEDVVTWQSGSILSETKAAELESPFTEETPLAPAAQVPSPLQNVEEVAEVPLLRLVTGKFPTTCVDRLIGVAPIAPVAELYVIGVVALKEESVTPPPLPVPQAAAAEVRVPPAPVSTHLPGVSAVSVMLEKLTASPCIT